MENNLPLVQYFSYKFNEWREGRIKSVGTNKKGFPEYEIITSHTDPIIGNIIRRKECDIRFTN